mmetsp:Transcript_7208/g.22197  ORF Transcript_7208/g.22197 Transcript_7208/m.22197 type:complete len:230 (+) Transcript_7208:1067-1756(+)
MAVGVDVAPAFEDVREADGLVRGIHGIVEVEAVERLSGRVSQREEVGFEGFGPRSAVEDEARRRRRAEEAVAERGPGERGREEDRPLAVSPGAVEGAISVAVRAHKADRLAEVHVLRGRKAPLAGPESPPLSGVVVERQRRRRNKKGELRERSDDTPFEVCSHPNSGRAFAVQQQTLLRRCRRRRCRRQSAHNDSGTEHAENPHCVGRVPHPALTHRRQKRKLGLVPSF